MAFAVTYLHIDFGTDAAGVPQTATVQYTVADGALERGDTYEMESPDFSKTLHNTGAVGEFYRDTLDEVKTMEGI